MFELKNLLRLLILSFLFALASVKTAWTDDREAKLRAFGHDRLVDAVLLYDQHFRVAETGQYLDAINLDGRQHTPLSSTASTGMGLISLAVGDALGVIDDAEEKAEITLSHLLGYAETEGFFVDRSKSGWFRHWFDVKTGKPPEWNGEKFSTIDTAILGAGAAILLSYLTDKAEKSGQPLSHAAHLAAELVLTVNWTTAIRNPRRGSIHLVFYGREERPTKRVATIPFDEYAILPCLAASHERLTGVPGKATKAWKRRFGSTEDLPMSTYENFTLLGKPKGSIPSHFTHQFAFYLCGAYAADPAFLDELEELMLADKSSFSQSGGPQELWGLGAGSELVFGDSGFALYQRYAVSRLEKNEQGTASPAIMAGFLAVDEARGKTDILSDLESLWSSGRCRYALAGLGFMWRCAPQAPKQLVTRVEGVDFSTWMLGLAAAHPKLGLAFFQRHAF